MSYPIATPLYTLGGWQGNAVDDSGAAWVVESEDGWSASPPVRPTRQDKTAGDGTWDGAGFFAGRVITLSGRCIAPDQLTMLAAKDRLKDAAGPGDQVTLQVDEMHLSRVAQVRLSDLVACTDQGPLVFTWALPLFAADPRRYSATSETLVTGLPPGGTTGRTYPRSYPLMYGGAGLTGSGAVAFTQAGNYKQTPAQIIFYGPVDTPTVEHDPSGRHLTFNLSLSYSDWLVVDLNPPGSALLNGSASRVNTLTADSAWFMLSSGLNELRFRGSAGTVPPGVTPVPVPSMQVTARSAWV